ncbi:hypothetical protein C8J57DRAFT_1242089 [Mycena rebaudengoi]|nr:hypothetical protein C8J57DRAFT_1242089 [Mycena rebaudengoi]
MLTPPLAGKPRFYLLPTLTSDVIPSPQILDGAVYNISGCTYSVTRGAGYTGEEAGGVGANGTRIAPDLPPHMPAYLAAFCGVSNATLGKILPPVMSARVRTRRSASIKFERVKIRAKLPTGYWVWPALWMLPMDDVYSGWPLSGSGFLLVGRGCVVIEHPGPVFDVIAAVLLIRRVAVICGVVPSQRRLTSGHDLRHGARRALLYPPAISLLFFASFFFLRPGLARSISWRRAGMGPRIRGSASSFLISFLSPFLGGLGGCCGLLGDRGIGVGGRAGVDDAERGITRVSFLGRWNEQGEMAAVWCWNAAGGGGCAGAVAPWGPMQLEARGRCSPLHVHWRRWAGEMTSLTRSLDLSCPTDEDGRDIG